ncbi:F-box/FBD/LRR-repeat protein At1g13570-like isoform X2 [Arachis stenosperma]|uniref:F-box/FBD/LRR-repeat protein At1g13570-like isoform X2 n=1 Tax=Arachis stenosperma TaxID=217475 RepID=UPI0025AC1016|nr:F-box/FBD/LRR-repeat protein At1g13570-like isoform X2 [Arachis stenosperma]
MDRLTSLPKVIILDDILTRLPYKDAARTSVLSKEWRDTWFSNQDMLIHYVTKRLLKLLDQGLAIKVFKLNMQCVDHKKMFYHVDLWMKMVSENGVQELELRLPLPTAYVAKGCTIDQEYDLPLCVIEAKSLTKLVLRGKIRFHQAFLNHSIKLFSVRMLRLCEVLFSHEGIVENLISHCPLIEHLTINDCYIYNPLSVPCPVRSLFLHGLEKLKEADVRGIQGVYIDAPNLENLCYCPLDVYAPFKLNLDSFTNLRCLRLFFLEGSIITDKWFVELFHKFHFLESLSLLCCSMSVKINILSAHSNAWSYQYSALT